MAPKPTQLFKTALKQISLKESDWVALSTNEKHLKYSLRNAYSQSISSNCGEYFVQCRGFKVYTNNKISHISDLIEEEGVSLAGIGRPKANVSIQQTALGINKKLLHVKIYDDKNTLFFESKEVLRTAFPLEKFEKDNSHVAPIYALLRNNIFSQLISSYMEIRESLILLDPLLDEMFVHETDNQPIHWFNPPQPSSKILKTETIEAINNVNNQLRIVDNGFRLSNCNRSFTQVYATQYYYYEYRQKSKLNPHFGLTPQEAKNMDIIEFFKNTRIINSNSQTPKLQSKANLVVCDGEYVYFIQLPQTSITDLSLIKVFLINGTLIDQIVITWPNRRSPKGGALLTDTSSVKVDSTGLSFNVFAYDYGENPSLSEKYFINIPVSSESTH
ncbi:unnamed protein product [Rotaria magnacalcarata]|uniref:Uncharacterized protein n=1 Tax=Rotaria magnacalcarata TaxID=392030 RepID=A0A816STZ9_9BILA|nr:unnamed protein product [Rotaria magnacalcarata]